MLRWASIEISLKGHIEIYKAHPEGKNLLHSMVTATPSPHHDHMCIGQIHLLP